MMMALSAEALQAISAAELLPISAAAPSAVAAAPSAVAAAPSAAAVAPAEAHVKSLPDGRGAPAELAFLVVRDLVVVVMHLARILRG